MTDRVLLLFMVILLLQSAYNLFFQNLTAKDAVMLDVVIRTTSAAIFGYFISAGFRGQAEAPATAKPVSIGFQPDPDRPSEPVGQLRGEAEASVGSDLQAGGVRSGSAPNRRVHQQILIVSMIGLASLITLILARDYAAPSPSTTATLSQLRDFVSGSVGFLIGHSAKDGGQPNGGRWICWHPKTKKGLSPLFFFILCATRPFSRDFCFFRRTAALSASRRSIRHRGEN